MLINEPALVLNFNWQPVNFLPIGTCISALLRDMAAVIHPETFAPLSFEEWMESAPADSRFIKTTGRPVPAPEVIVLKKYGQQPPRRVNFNRQNLFTRDEHTCQYCGDSLPTSRLQIEHVLPRSRGGPTTWENCVAACDDCNSRKADRTPSEAKMKLRKTPAAPKWKPSVRPPRGELRPIWAQFLRHGA